MSENVNCAGTTKVTVKSHGNLKRKDLRCPRSRKAHTGGTRRDVFGVWATVPSTGSSNGEDPIATVDSRVRRTCKSATVKKGTQASPGLEIDGALDQYRRAHRRGTTVLSRADTCTCTRTPSLNWIRSVAYLSANSSAVANK